MRTRHVIRFRPIKKYVKMEWFSFAHLYKTSLLKEKKCNRRLSFTPQRFINCIFTSVHPKINKTFNK